MPYVYSRVDQLEGEPKVGSTQCVALVQAYARVPNHLGWKAGDPVLGNKTILPGTAIATFVKGRYLSQPTGNHAAFFLRHGINGFWIMDQWKDPKKKPVISSHFIRALGLRQHENGSWPMASDNADAYSIIEPR